MMSYHFLGAFLWGWERNKEISKDFVWNLGFLLKSQKLVFVACCLSFLSEDAESVLALIEKSESASLDSNDLNLMKLCIYEAVNDPRWIKEMNLLSLREFDLTDRQLQLLNKIIIQGGKKRFLNLIKES